MAVPSGTLQFVGDASIANVSDVPRKVIEQATESSLAPDDPLEHRFRTKVWKNHTSVLLKGGGHRC